MAKRAAREGMRGEGATYKLEGERESKPLDPPNPLGLTPMLGLLVPRPPAPPVRRSSMTARSPRWQAVCSGVQPCRSIKFTLIPDFTRRYCTMSAFPASTAAWSGVPPKRSRSCIIEASSFSSSSTSFNVPDSRIREWRRGASSFLLLPNRPWLPLRMDMGGSRGPLSLTLARSVSRHPASPRCGLFNQLKKKETNRQSI